MSNFDHNELIVSKMAIDFDDGFQLLFITYYKPLMRIAEKMIGAEFAEDIIQDTFMMIWNGRKSFDNVFSLKSYLYTTVHNKCLNVIRKHSLLEKYREEYQMDLFEEYIFDEDVIAQLYQAMDLLPDHYKETMLKTLNGESIANIALSMDTTEDTIKAYKRRAKQLLKKKLCNQTLIFFF